MKILKTTGLIFLVICLSLFFFSCADSGSGSDYSAVSVAQLSVSDITEGTVLNPVSDQSGFESKILGPLVSSASSSSSSVSRMLSSALTQSTTAKTAFAESDSDGDTIDLTSYSGSPYTSGSLKYTGSYSVSGEIDDDADIISSLNITANLKSTLSNAAMSIDSNNYTASGKANAGLLADFGMEIDSTGGVKIDLDYGVAFSLGMIINVDNTTDDTKDAGALVIMDLKLSKSNHKTYSETDYYDEEEMMMAVVTESIPTDATLNVSVYNNSHDLIFTHSYNMAEIEELMYPN